MPGPISGYRRRYKVTYIDNGGGVSQFLKLFNSAGDSLTLQADSSGRVPFIKSNGDSALLPISGEFLQ